MQEAFQKIIDQLKAESIIVDDDAGNRAVEIIEQAVEEFAHDTNVGNNGWIPCSVVDHPEHSHDCEVTMINTNGYTREIAFCSCTGRWVRSSDEAEITVVAWKEPSEPYKPKGE